MACVRDCACQCWEVCRTVVESTLAQTAASVFVVLTSKFPGAMGEKAGKSTQGFENGVLLLLLLLLLLLSFSL